MTVYSQIIKQRLAPCGLHCGKCFAFVDGEVQEHSKKLKSALGNFAGYAERFVEILDEPLFMKYPSFEEFLNLLTISNCKGCREEKCKLFKNCGVRPCSEEKGVDFCFQCSEFPCDNTNFDHNLYSRYVGINKYMKKIGVEDFYKEIKDLQRY